MKWFVRLTLSKICSLIRILRLSRKIFTFAHFASFAQKK